MSRRHMRRYTTNIYIVNNERLYYTGIFQMDYETGRQRHAIAGAFDTQSK